MALYPGLDVFDIVRTQDQPTTIFDSFFPIHAKVGNIRSDASFSFQHRWKLKTPINMVRTVETAGNMKKEITLVVHQETQSHDNELKDILHEIPILSSLDHSNVLKFYEIVSGGNLTDVAFIFEPVGAILSLLMSENISKLYEPQVIKSITKDLFKALDYLHQNHIIHGNIQPENIVLSPSGVLKLWNFRNAQKVGQKMKKLKVNDFRYQSVELLMQTENYDQSVDIWGAICIFAELWLTKSLFIDHGREKVLTAIFKLLGFPKQEIWEEFFSFPGVEELCNFSRHNKYNMLDIYFKKHCNRPVSVYAMDLMHRGFRYNPKYRPSAEQCLVHPYFFEEEEACSDEDVAVILNAAWDLIQNAEDDPLINNSLNVFFSVS